MRREREKREKLKKNRGQFLQGQLRKTKRNSRPKARHSHRYPCQVCLVHGGIGNRQNFLLVFPHDPRMADFGHSWVRESEERGGHDGSKLFKWHTLSLSCCNMTFHSQLTVANSAAVDELLQGILIALNCFKDVPWWCLALMWHPILSWQWPTFAQAVYPQLMIVPSNVFKDAVDRLFQAP